MPARPPVPAVVQIVQRFTLGEDVRIINRFYQKYSGTPGTLNDADAALWAVAIANGWAANMAADVSTSLVLDDTSVTDLSSSTGAFGHILTSAAGALTDAVLPAQVAMVIKEHIERRYRGGHPRQYLTGFTEIAVNDPQTWKPASTAGVLASYIAFRAAAALGAPVALRPAVDVNVSFYEGFTNHTYPSGRVRPVPNLRVTPVVDVIASFGVNPIMASQRRRALQSA
jgi:hypothetical protein